MKSLIMNGNILKIKDRRQIYGEKIEIEKMLKRLWQYCNKIFKLDKALQQLKNQGFSEKNNEPLLTTILLVAMFMRVRSYNALKQSLKKNSKKWKKLLGGIAPPSISTLDRGTEKSDIDGLYQINKRNNQKLHRNKVFNIDEASHGLMVVAVDGHETFSSECRCCPQCLTRKKTIKVKTKVKVEQNGKIKFEVKEEEKEVIEYYHKYVVCQLILCSVPVIIDIETIMPGEGELTAAKRLIKRILKEQSRRVDVFCFDALYLDSYLLNMIDEKKKFWVAVLKQANRDAYKEIDRALSSIKPIKTEINKRKVTLWDMEELVGWDKLKKTFRAVVSYEEYWKWELNPKTREKEKVLKTQVWRWLTNMPSIYKAEIVYKFGHGRWDVENRGFHDLATNCRLDHPFHHHPTALLAMMWIISIAFNLSYAFYQRNLKSQLKKCIKTRQQLSVEIRSDIKTLDEPLICARAP